MVSKSLVLIITEDLVSLKPKGEPLVEQSIN